MQRYTEYLFSGVTNSGRVRTSGGRHQLGRRNAPESDVQSVGLGLIPRLRPFN